MKHTPPKNVVANAKRGVELSKDASISNNALPETSLKGGKKIASGQQISDDHVRSMSQYHAAHAGSCPAGSDADGCDDLLWGGQAGGQWAASRVAAMDATSLSLDQGPEIDTLLAGGDPFAIELYTRPDLLLEGKTDLAKDSEGLIWAPILRSGTLACRPDPTSPTGRKNEPLVFVAGHSANPKEIGLADLKDAFEETAVQHVTIPKTHGNNEFENTGFIKKLKMAPSTLRPGETVLLAGHEFLDADAEARVERGLIANRSCGILHGYQNTETGKTYPHVIEHVALTNKPWVSGMEAYGQNSVFSDGRPIAAMMLSDERQIHPADPTKLPKEIFSTADPRERFERELKLSDVAWSDDQGGPSLSQIESGLYDAFSDLGRSPFYDENSVYFSVRDVKIDRALVTMPGGGNPFVIPFTFADGKLTLSDFSKWVPVTQEWVVDEDAATDQAETQQAIDADPTNLSVSAADRKKAQSDGDAMSDGKFPITSQTQANKAYILRNSSKNHKPDEVLAHIKKQVKKHGLTMPGSNHALLALPSDPLKRASMLRLSQESNTPAPTGGISMLTQAQLDSLNLSAEDKAVLQRSIDEDARVHADLARYREADKQTGLATRLARVKEIFGEDKTGTIAVFADLLSADDGDVAATLLSSDPITHQQTRSNLTMTQVVDKILASFPAADPASTQLANGKTSLLENPLTGRPDLNPDKTELGETKALTGDELLAQWAAAVPDGTLNLAMPTPAAAK